MLRPLPFVVVTALAGCGGASLPGDLPDMSVTQQCADHAQDGDETDVDCGGATCQPCGAGLGCSAGTDCQSTFCTNRKCDPPSCSDGVKNGFETDLDCGGGVCAVCDDGKMCSQGTDCKSATCTNNVCQGAGGNTYLPAGVATNLPVAMLTGWTPCYNDTYASSGILLAQVLNACAKSKLFFGCRFAGSQTILVGAWIPRANVSLLPAINGAQGGNGTQWIFANKVNDYGCWAFVPNGDTLPGGSCDLDSGGPTHLSWSTFDAETAPGYRCGNDSRLDTNQYERVIFHAD